MSQELQLTSLLNRCAQLSGVATLQLQGSPRERVQAVASLYGEIDDLLTEAASAGIVNKARLSAEGGWIGSPFIRTAQTTNTNGVFIGRSGRRGREADDVESQSRHHLAADNWQEIFTSAVRHVQNRTLAVINASTEQSPREPTGGRPSLKI